MKELIEFLVKEGFSKEADSLRNGGTSLNLTQYRYRIGNDGIKLLAKALTANIKLTSITLWYIDTEQITMLTEALRTNTTLTSLNFISINSSCLLALSYKDYAPTSIDKGYFFPALYMLKYLWFGLDFEKKMIIEQEEKIKNY